MAKYSTLEEILNYMGFRGEIDGDDWNRAYNKLILILESVGILTEHSREMNQIVSILDKIDSENY